MFININACSVYAYLVSVYDPQLNIGGPFKHLCERL